MTNDPSAMRYAIHSVKREGDVTSVDFTAYQGDKVVDTTLRRFDGKAPIPFRFKNAGQVRPGFLAALAGPLEPAPDLSALQAPTDHANPIMHGTHHREDMGYGMEVHWHQCPDCFHLFRHLRPVLPTGEGWTTRRAQARIKSEEAASETGHYSQYRDVQHVCPHCKNGKPILPWARGPLYHKLMGETYFPMMLA